MQFFKEHIDNLDNINKIDGEVTCIENNIFLKKIDNTYIEIINNRALHNDKVFINNETNEVLCIIERNIKRIVGILYLDSKIKYGFYKDKMLYLFKPTNKKYSNFYIPYKGNLKNKTFVIIEFKEWKITDKLPIGTLLDIIGEIGIKDNEYEHLRNFFEIKNNVWKIDNNKKNKDIEKINKISDIESDYNVFSIDPIGSKDIDDAFHYKYLSEDLFEIGIHIANPFIFFENNLQEILERISTVYLPNKKYNMLPNIYADDLLSLIENKNRFAVSLILNINRNNLIINSFEIKETIVKNIKNYNYDEFDIILKKNKELKKFVNDSKLYFKSLNNNIDNFDSHKLVEYWMIFTNKFIANYLINECKNKIIDKDYSGNIILRILTRKNIENNNSNIFIESSLIEYINNKNENSALYELFDEEMEKNQFHYKLGNEYYTHFTSPIRRVVDIIIHGILLKNNKLMDKKLLENYLIKINKFNKNNRRFDRNIKRLEFLYNQKEKKENIITFGYIINIQERYIKIYLPEYGLEEKIIIIPFIFKNIVESVVEKNDFDEIKSIKYILDEKEYYYKLYQKLNIKLWIFLFAENIFDKLKIEII